MTKPLIRMTKEHVITNIEFAARRLAAVFSHLGFVILSSVGIRN